MVSDDAVRWDEKHLKNKHPDTPQPDPLLVDYIDLFLPGQLVVDLASGSGRHSLLLAAQGCFVVPLDCSLVALRRCRDNAHANDLNVYPVVADLTEFRFQPESLDAIICFNYLNRDLSNNICDALKPGGILVMKTFNVNFLITNPKFNSNYVLAPGELSKMFKDLEIVFLNDDCRTPDRPKSAVVATKA